eukprot:s3646_g8.t1
MAMQPRLELESVPVDDFETYKHQPALIESTSVFPLSVDEADAENFEIMSALEAEAEARADSGLVSWECYPPASDASNVTCFRSPVTSMTLAAPNAVVISLAADDASCPVLVLRISTDGTARVVHETSLPGKRIFLSTASMEPDARTVKTLAYRTVRNSGSGGHVEVLAVQMELTDQLRPEAKILGRRKAAMSREILLVSLGGFVLQPDAAEVAAFAQETEDAVLTTWTPQGLLRWPLPRGELLSAEESEDGVRLVLSDPSGAALLLDLAAASFVAPAAPRLPVALALPGAAACATARRLWAFEVSIYRTPCGALASPMASLSGHGPVRALRATAGGAVVLRTRSGGRAEAVKGPKPATATVLCPATSPCGSPLTPTTASTTPWVPTPTMATSTAPTAPPTTTVQAGPSPVWVYTAWMTDRTNCHARRCGEGRLYAHLAGGDIGQSHPFSRAVNVPVVAGATKVWLVFPLCATCALIKADYRAAMKPLE